MAESLKWLSKQALLLAHEESLQEHGGMRGMRDEGLLDSALARPHHLLTYQPSTSLAQLAAAYVFDITKNHPFADGNKRAAFVTLGLFLPPNGWKLQAASIDAFTTIMALASGQMDEEALAAWINRHLVQESR
jgi:death-on-curing protein